ncbi:DUF4169 domain-containing protein [Kaistia sp. 32K]|uniref:DUF4169 family protein n=1 Tax=Kaistia sp. 32K TaxID=2795690 RepID=UPI00191697D5|nr:DUF4169 family protein [Kaistia sp. 32K]BCP54404.1 DUF4169 domain-containing protein [Kaistia sp. 32K]
MTAEIINLNRFRKEKVRQEKAATAEENRVRFGRNRAERALDRIAAEKARRHLDDHQRDDGKDPTVA